MLIYLGVALTCMVNGESSVYHSQEGYHTFRGGFWNYFSMGKEFENVDLGLGLALSFICLWCQRTFTIDIKDN